MAAGNSSFNRLITRTPRVSWPSFSPDSRLAAFGDIPEPSCRWISLRRFNVGRTIRRLSSDLTGHRSALTSVDFVLGGQFIVSAGWDNTVRLWSPGGQQVMIMEGGRSMAATLTGDKRLLVWQGKRVQLFDLVSAPQECFLVY